MSAEARAAAAETGILPHEFLLRVMRGEYVSGKDRPSMTQRLDAAKAAAPFFAPRMSSINHDGGIKVEEKKCSNLELARRICFMGELVAQEIESKRPDLAPIDRRPVIQKVMDTLLEAAKEKPYSGKPASR